MQTAAVPGYAGQLELVVVSAHGLAAKEGKADPYVVISVFAESNPAMPEHHGRTRVVKRSTEPTWDESFAFDFGSDASNDHRLRVEVWDWNQIMRDRFLGQADLSLVGGERLQEGVEAELELPLVQREGKSKGKVTGAIRVKAKLAADYHRQRTERAEAQAKAVRERREEQERLVAQVRLTRKTAETLIEQFRGYAGAKGSIGRSEFLSVFVAMDEPTRRAIKEQIASADDLFDCLDVNHDGSLDVEELLFGISTLATGTLDDKAELIFKAMDRDGSGSLSRDEVKVQFEKLFKSMCSYIKRTVTDLVYKKHKQFIPDATLKPLLDNMTEPLKKQLMEDGVDHLFRHGDTDNDNQLSLEEWRELVKSDEMAQWLVSPEIYVAKVNTKMGPKIAALLQSK